MPIQLENLVITLRDLEASMAFFTDLGLTVLGRDTVSSAWTETAVGLDGTLPTTTRSVPKRLDLDRQVDLTLVREALTSALQAPSGSNAQGVALPRRDGP